MSAVASTSRESFWHGGFLRIVLANLLVSASVYMFLPFFPELVAGKGWETSGAVYGWAAVMYCVGVCLPAPLCNYWLDTYRRKRVVQWALLALIPVSALMFFDVPLWGLLLLRLLQGGAHSVFQIALGSTLLLDLSNTKQRTEVAHMYYWFTRIALVFGPLVSLIIPSGEYGSTVFMVLCIVLSLVAWMLVSTLSVPFRAPLNPVLFSLDRFWLPRGFRIFVPLLLTSLSIGTFLAEVRQGEFYILLAVGFFLALFVHQMCLKENLQAEIVSGFVLLLIAGGLRLFQVDFVGIVIGMGILIGMGSGFVTSRFLLSYIRICQHCERGTAQTSYWMGWECGLAVGFSLSCMLTVYGCDNASLLSLFLFVLACAFYLFGVRKWYVSHKRK